MNPRQMQGMMRKMGITQQEIPAVKVIIQTKDTEIIIENPSVAKVKMMGQDTYQITGEAIEKELNTTPEINEEDINTVMEQTGSDKETALSAIQESNGDLAEAILSLTKEE